MRWPFKRKSSGDQWVVSWSGQMLCYVAARVTAPGKWNVVKMGVEVQGDDSMELFVQRLQTLGLRGANAVVMLRPEQYQLLQIDAPPVAPEELKSAARYQIRELLDVHIDDVTLDIMKVGDGQQKGTEHLFVVAATNAVVRQSMELVDAMHWDVSVIDIQETAQRNLQTAVARVAGSAARAQALLVISDERQALLTISANDELFYARRLDLPKGFMDMAWEQADAPVVDDGFTPVQEYVPDYNGGGASYGADYSAASPAGGGNEQAQRVLVEVQRSLDLWDRTWSALPLAGLQVMAGDRSAELATWLGREMGQTVGVLELSGLFGGLDVTAPNQRAVCAPLLGVLLRTEARKL